MDNGNNMYMPVALAYGYGNGGFGSGMGTSVKKTTQIINGKKEYN